MIVIEQAPSTKQNPAFLNQADWSPLSVLGFEPYNTIKFIIYFVMFQVIHFYLTCGSLDAFLRNSYCKGSIHLHQKQVLSKWKNEIQYVTVTKITWNLIKYLCKCSFVWSWVICREDGDNFLDKFF